MRKRLPTECTTAESTLEILYTHIDQILTNAITFTAKLVIYSSTCLQLITNP
jgi:hypothetical protein